MTTDAFIDVTALEPRMKHPTIFTAFDNLADGAAVVIHNDHDPKPLYYQLLGERGACFSWTYLSSGPEVWEVSIRKNAAREEAETVGAIAAKDLKKAEYFKKVGIDFCCGGKKTLAEACAEKGLDTVRVAQELEAAGRAQTATPQHDFDSWALSFLADYIVNVHHTFIRRNAPILADLSRKVAGHHGAAHPELLSLDGKVTELLNELITHLKKEEQILFPYIKKLEAAAGTSMPSPFGTIRNPIWMMESDHEAVGVLLQELRALTGDYTLPADACNSYSLLYRMLQDLEADLHIHIHLENNILFPKAIRLEQSGTAPAADGQLTGVACQLPGKV